MIDIGIAGAMGAGKTTLADMLAAQYGYTRLSFADPIRYLTALLVGRPIDKKHDRAVMQRVGGAARSPVWQAIDTPWEEARAERTQQLAEHIFPEATPERVTALYRALYVENYSYNWGQERYWIQRWQREYIRSPRPVALDDLRFPIEGEVLRRQGFFVVRLEVPFEERKRRITQRDGRWDDAWMNDATELNVNDIPAHATLDGTGTPEAIAQEVLRLARGWK